MFGLFSSPPFFDAQLGELRRSGGMWRGRISCGNSTAVPLIVAGPRSAPDAAALESARSISTLYPAWRSRIENSFFAHFVPYAEGIAAGELPPPEGPLPAIEIPSDVWPHVSLAFVAVSPLDGKPGIELGYSVAWDEEHTLGVRFREGRFVELCGSVICP